MPARLSLDALFSFGIEKYEQMSCRAKELLL